MQSDDPNERLRAVLTLMHEIANLEAALKVSGDLSATDAVKVNREEVERLRARLQFLIAQH